MKRLLFASLATLALALTAAPAQAGWCFDYSVCRHISCTFTGRNRCLTYTSCSNPVCAPSCGYAGPSLWDGLAAYGGHAYGAPAYPAPVAAAPAATTTPSSTTPSFQAPQPSPAPKGSTGLQQAAYYYYGQPAQTGYNPNAGYNYGAGYGYYGAGYGYSYAQAPNYWY